MQTEHDCRDEQQAEHLVAHRHAPAEIESLSREHNPHERGGNERATAGPPELGTCLTDQ